MENEAFRQSTLYTLEVLFFFIVQVGFCKRVGFPVVAPTVLTRFKPVDEYRASGQNLCPAVPKNLTLV